MTNKSRSLDVYIGDTLIGHLREDGPTFEMLDPVNTLKYFPSLADAPFNSVSAGSRSYQGPAIDAIFENLLPEGDARKRWQMGHHVTSTFGMLKLLGEDTVGSLRVVSSGDAIRRQRYVETSWQDIANHLWDASAELENEGSLSKQRISLSGAQQKYGICLTPEGDPQVPLGSSPSTHILKPDISIPGLKVWASAANEALMMKAATHMGMSAPDVRYNALARCAIIERFDRYQTWRGELKVKWQQDFCQLLGVVSEGKYESDGGPSFGDCLNVIRQHSSEPEADVHRAIQWLSFNIVIGNNDSHAKNLSLYEIAPGKRVLTPFYDLLSTEIYSGLSRNFAFSIGGEFAPGKWGPEHLKAFAADIEYPLDLLRQELKNACDLVPAAYAKANDELAASFGPTEKKLAERIRQYVHSNANKLVRRLDLGGGNKDVLPARPTFDKPR